MPPWTAGSATARQATRQPATIRVRPDLSKGRVWVTRKDVHVDRIASAWLIRRFIDPKARFKFVPSQGLHRGRTNSGSDMFEAEFTHEGDHCSFETLVHRFGLKDSATAHSGGNGPRHRLQGWEVPPRRNDMDCSA